MAKEVMDNTLFEGLLARINQETSCTEKKIEILFNSRGYFSAYQASRLLYAFGIPSDKLRVIQILEPRLCQMTCSEARDILWAIGIQNDRVAALECIKRYLCDCQARHGMENILSCFPFEHDKRQAMGVLYTVRSDVVDAVPAGGHQGYAALGGLYTQCRPLVPHLYGNIQIQEQYRPGKGKIEVPVTANAGVLPSMYTGHPSYAYPRGRDYAEDRGYPGAQDMYPGEPTVQMTYPAGAPIIGQHQGAPAPTGFPGLSA